MAGESDAETNVDCLLKHLKPDSLAEKLVRAHGAAHPQGKTGSMREVLMERLEEARAKIDGAAD